MYVFLRKVYRLFFFFNYYLQTKVTPIVEGYGGWALRMEIVPIESAYPGFGDLVVSVV